MSYLLGIGVALSNSKANQTTTGSPALNGDRKGFRPFGTKLALSNPEVDQHTTGSPALAGGDKTFWGLPTSFP